MPKWDYDQTVELLALIFRFTSRSLTMPVRQLCCDHGMTLQASLPHVDQHLHGVCQAQSKVMVRVKDDNIEHRTYNMQHRT